MWMIGQLHAPAALTLQEETVAPIEFKVGCALMCKQPSTSIQDLFHPNPWQTPVAAITVYSAPDDGRKGRPKHVEHTCSC